MSTIVRGKVLQGTSGSDNRVHISVDSIYQDIECDVLNGVYLRSGDLVFVRVEDEFRCPLVIGRCSGQLELPELVKIINALVDVINNHAQQFNMHTHVATELASPTTPPTSSTPPTNFKTGNKLNINDILH